MSRVSLVRLEKGRRISEAQPLFPATAAPLTTQALRVLKMANSEIPAARAAVTRSAAMAAGLKRYVSDVPCRNGHVGERSVNTNRCSICEKASAQASAARNVEATKKRNSRRPKEDPALRRARYLANKEANPEKIKAARRASKAANREAINAAQRAYRAANKDAYNADSRARRHTRRALLKAGGTHTPADIKIKLEAQRGKCGYCRIALKKGFEVDHIHPIAKGGSNAPKNLQLLCRPCNRRKSAKDPIDFAQEIGRLA